MLRSVFVAPMATCAAALSLVLAAPIQAQQPDDPTPLANPADVGSIDAIMTALYDVISGPIGQDRDRARFLSLFAEGARLIPTGRNQETGKVGLRMMSPEEYWANSSDLLKRIGFTEDEIGRTTETFGNITHHLQLLCVLPGGPRRSRHGLQPGDQLGAAPERRRALVDRVGLLGLGTARQSDPEQVHRPLTGAAALAVTSTAETHIDRRDAHRPKGGISTERTCPRAEYVS